MKWVAIFLSGVLLGAIGVHFSWRSLAPTPAPLTVFLPAALATATPCEAIVPFTVPNISASLTLPVAPITAPIITAPIIAAPVFAAPAVAANQLLIPVFGISASQLNDTFQEARGTNRRHDAIDILAPRGTQVLAVADGTVAKLFDSKPGGLTLYQFDAPEKLAYYYAHLDRYAAGIIEGTILKQGDLIGYVGTTGNANPATPHLHFAIFELGPEKKWWQGSPINPYPLLGGATSH